MILSFTYFSMSQHSIAVLFLSMLFQSRFAKYFLVALYLPLWKFLLYFYVFLFYFDVKMYLIMITVTKWLMYFNIID